MCRSVVSIVVIVYIRPVLAGLKRPDQDKKAWEPKLIAASSGINYDFFANGNGVVRMDGRSECYGKWQDAEIYGARKKAIKQFCVRIHEKHQDDDGYKSLPREYYCVFDPNDKGNDHGMRNRDWL
ncbi:hypothetical protein Pmar_PMAR000405 [Perkinsus marinus ATCC 50983]|uniref:Secreted protein n=1 Tax=Perkinsus marinus (strain ATCC 50983 / TXsc) TaxID=423536 RepID=C5L4C9_PERM5|nr:hypothetical protein Pmar_PMAR000405 [Perkinsus marinus ATCC 50983]EER08366.1 hypothetical protein Pmar_PMAR000405 [Perkinsus marinus ATCC 50983]|eukprot:XP_002776550.1 hypothetical protein Pmar_PMAR000405 [Perkinsus marinus ATCC 50983]